MHRSKGWIMALAMALKQAHALVVTVTEWQSEDSCSISLISPSFADKAEMRLGSSTAATSSAQSTDISSNDYLDPSTEKVSTASTIQSPIGTNSAINLVSSIVGSGSVAATVVTIAPSSTVPQSVATVSAAVALPTTSDVPRCGTVFLNADQQLSRIYCNATLGGDSLPVSDDKVTIVYCITACEQKDDCVAAIFDNSTNTVPSGNGQCSLIGPSGSTYRKRQDVPTLTWQEGIYFAYRVYDINEPLPNDPLNPSGEPTTASSTSAFQLIPSIQSPLDLSTTVPPTGAGILPTGVPLGVSVVFTTSSSAPSFSEPEQQSRVQGSVSQPQAANRATRVGRLTTTSPDQSRIQGSTTSSTQAANRVSRASRVTTTSSTTQRRTTSPAQSRGEASTTSTTRAVVPARVTRITRGSATTTSTTSTSRSSTTRTTTSSRSSSTSTIPSLRLTTSTVSSSGFTTITSTSIRSTTSTTSSQLLTTSSTSSSDNDSEDSASTRTADSRVSVDRPTPTPPTSTSTSSSSRISTTSSRTSFSSLAPRLAKPTLLGTGVDETQYGIALPFTMSLYTESATNLTVTTNGILSLGEQSLVYEAYTDNSGYPEDLPSQELIPGTALVWWQYLESFSGAPLGVYYSITDSHLLSVEWLMHDNDGLVTNVVMTYDSNKPGGVTYYYFTDGDTGENSVVGVQVLDTGNNWAAVTYEAGEAGTISAGLMLTFTTNPSKTSTGSYAASRFSLSCFPQGSFPSGTCGTAAT